LQSNGVVIVRALQRSGDQCLRAGFFTDLLQRHFTETDAAAQLEIALDWGRYGELFTLDITRDEVCLDASPALDRGVEGMSVSPSST
jgi:NitT/TauT family transport system ATP-binding protein